MRSVEEWVGATDNTPIPPRVRIRIFQRENGVCHISGRKIGPADAWDLDHRVALCNGGENRESNLFPALRDRHKEKTAKDVAEKKAISRKRGKHLGIKKRKSRPMAGTKASGWHKRMDGTVERW